MTGKESPPTVGLFWGRSN